MILRRLKFKPAMTLASDYLALVLQTTIKDKKGFLEIYEKKEEPIYKIEKNSITAMALAGIDKELAELVIERVNRKDVIENLANITKMNPPIEIAAAFYNNEQPIERFLTFYPLTEPIELDDNFFKELTNYINPTRLADQSKEITNLDAALDKAFTF